MFQSNLSNRKFSVNYKNFFPQISSIICGVPQGSLLGSLLHLIYVIDMQMPVKCNLFLYADDTCLYLQSIKTLRLSKSS